MSEQSFSFDHTKLVEGAEFYELCYGRPVLYKVTKAANFIRDNELGPQLEWQGVLVLEPSSEPVNFLLTFGYEHYGPKIYLKDEIVEVNGRLFSTR